MKAIFIKGIIASGKSTFAKEFVEKNLDYKRINRDSIREMIDNYKFSKESENLVTKIEREAIKSSLLSGYNIIIDKMNLNKRDFENDINFIKGIVSDIEIEIIEFPITLSEAIERDSKRVKPITASVIKRVWDRYEIELKEMLERNKPNLGQNKNLEKCIIVDIDGTLSNSYKRKIYDYSKVSEDICIESVKEIINSFDGKIFIFSGREDICFDITSKWLESNLIRFNKLVMRKSNDYRSDIIVKKEMFEEFIKDKYYCVGVFDDRPCVLKMWQDMGLFTFNVNQDVYAKNDF